MFNHDNSAADTGGHGGVSVATITVNGNVYMLTSELVSMYRLKY